QARVDALHREAGTLDDPHELGDRVHADRRALLALPARPRPVPRGVDAPAHGIEHGRLPEPRAVGQRALEALATRLLRDDVVAVIGLDDHGAARADRARERRHDRAIVDLVAVAE